MKNKRLSIFVRLPDGQEVSFWVWEEKDRAKAEIWATTLELLAASAKAKTGPSS